MVVIIIITDEVAVECVQVDLVDGAAVAAAVTDVTGVHVIGACEINAVVVGDGV